MRWLLVSLLAIGCSKSKPAAKPSVAADGVAPPCAPELVAVGSQPVRLPRALAELAADPLAVSLSATFFADELSLAWTATVKPDRAFPEGYAAAIETTTGRAPELDDGDPLATKSVARWGDGDATFEVAASAYTGSVREVTLTYACWGPFARPFSLDDARSFAADLWPGWMPDELRAPFDDRVIARVELAAADAREYTLSLMADDAWKERWRADLVARGYTATEEEDGTRYTSADGAYEVVEKHWGDGLVVTIVARATPPA